MRIFNPEPPADFPDWYNDDSEDEEEDSF